MEDDPSQDDRGTWDGSKVVILFVAFLLLLFVGIILISAGAGGGGHDMDDMGGRDMGLGVQSLPSRV